MIEQVTAWGWYSITPEWKEEPVSSSTRGWNPYTPQQKKDSQSVLQAHNSGNIRRHKRMKITHFAFIYEYLELFRKNTALHPPPFQKCIGIIKKKTTENMHHHFISFFGFGSNLLNIFISLQSSPFLLDLGIHPSKTGAKL